MFLRINMAQAEENNYIHEKYEAVSASDQRNKQILEAHEDHIGDQQNEILGLKAIVLHDSEKLKDMDKMEKRLRQLGQHGFLESLKSQEQRHYDSQGSIVDIPSGETANFQMQEMNNNGNQ